ncbi:MAG TPA: hypothetical protein VGG74_28665 [Kofleriaceae bacterium]
MGKQSRLKAARRMEREQADARNPLAYLGFYTGVKAILGDRLNAAELTEHIGKFDWEHAFVSCASMASMIANHREGLNADAVRHAALDPLLQPAPNGPIEPIRAHVREHYDQLIIAHEEVLSFLQHVIILHGGDGEPIANDFARSMWMLAAADYLDRWSEADARVLTKTEHLIAECAKASRFNRHSDPLRDVARVYLMFKDPPESGAFSDPQEWEALQRAAFGVPYDVHFETRLFPLFMISKGWGTGTTKHSELPVINRKTWSGIFKQDAAQVADWLSSVSVDRATLQAITRSRLQTGTQLPHSPTALLHHPFVKFKDDFIAIASPWMMKAHLVGGVWAAFLAAARSMGDPLQWMRCFGYLFEGWLRRVARMVPSTSTTKIVLASKIGGDDEVEDVVALEPGHAVLFSAKSKMVTEPVARWSASRSKVVDWYEEFFFSKKKGDQRGGAVRLLSARIDALRAGTFEKYGVSRELHVIPVLVTFDDMGEDIHLYEWIEERCRTEGLLQQQAVSPLVLANVDEYERIMAMTARQESISSFLRERDTTWRQRRINVQLRSTRADDRFPEMVEAFNRVVNAMGQRTIAVMSDGSVTNE